MGKSKLLTKLMIFGTVVNIVSCSAIQTHGALSDCQRIFPAIVKPTAAERAVLVKDLPDFYIRFTEQQREILHAGGQ